MTAFDTFEKEALWVNRFDATEKLKAVNDCFASKVKPERGYFGTSLIDKGNGATEILGKNELGHVFKDYYQDGRLIKSRAALGNREWLTTLFDDAGTPYLTSTSKITSEGLRGIEMALKPNTTVTKGNYSAVIDQLGRPILNKVADLQLRPEGALRKTLSPALKDSSYRLGDNRGHIIADLFGGPATKDNIVAQLEEINKGQFKEIENLVKRLKTEGHKVDYEVRTNYKGSNKRPSSFEPKITVDGKEYKLSPELRKIYNDVDLSTADCIMTTAGDKFGLVNELGLKTDSTIASIIFSVSTVENVSCFLDGTITTEEMILNIIEDLAAAGAIDNKTALISISVSRAMSSSSSALISRIGNSCAPAAVVSFAVASYGDISDFAQGKIDGAELAYNLGENAAEVAGGFAGGIITGAALGSIAGPAGAAIGGIVGGVVGCAVASEAYETAVELGSDAVDALGEHVNKLTDFTIKEIATKAPEQLGNAKAAFNDFFSSNKLPFSV